MVLISVNRFIAAGLPRFSRAHFTLPPSIWQAKSVKIAYFGVVVRYSVRGRRFFVPDEVSVLRKMSCSGCHGLFEFT